MMIKMARIKYEASKFKKIRILDKFKITDIKMNKKVKWSDRIMIKV